MSPRRRAGLRRGFFGLAAAVLAAGLPAAAGAGQARSGPSARTSEALVRIVTLEDTRSFGDGWLASRVYDPDHEVRRQAALALGRIGRPPAVAPLADALAHDAAGAVRAAAAFALGLVEDPLPEEAMAALTAALADPSPLVQEKAIEAIGRRGGRAPGLVESRLGEILGATAGFSGWRENVEASSRRSSFDGPRLALYALAATGEGGASPEAARLLFAPDGSPATNWWAAAWTAARLAHPDLAPLYRIYAEAPDPVVRRMGLDGISRIAAAAMPGPAAFGPVLAGAWTNPDPAVRVAALGATARLAEAGRPVPDGAGSALLRALHDEVRSVRLAALAALARVTHPPAASDLLDLLQAPSPDFRAGALRALHHQDPRGFFLLLSGWSDPDPAGRAEAARALAGIPDSRIQDFLIRTLLSDADAGVRAAALTALSRRPAAPSPEGTDEAAARAVVERLDAPSAVEREAAAEALFVLSGRMEDAAWADASARLGRAAGADTGAAPGFRLAALRALLSRGPENTRVETSETALADPSWPIRREAHAFLRSRGEEPAEPAPAPALEPADYEGMVHPPFTPVAWIETDRGEIEVELFIADAPRTVWRFMEQARSGAWNGVPFADVAANRAVETAPPGAGGDADRTVRSEANERFAMRGTLGLLDDVKDAAGSAFFIALLPQPQWNGRRTLFGHIRTGFRVLDQIEPGDRIRRIRIWDGVTPPD